MQSQGGAGASPANNDFSANSLNIFLRRPIRKLMEMRRHTRATLKTEIWLGQDGIFTQTSETLRELSEGGAFLETSQRFSVGTILHLRFKLPGSSRLISCTVCVRNLRDGSGLGVQFLDISPDDKNLVSCFIENQVQHA